jgi:hypothetical protein
MILVRVSQIGSATAAPVDTGNRQSKGPITADILYCCTVNQRCVLHPANRKIYNGNGLKIAATGSFVLLFKIIEQDVAVMVVQLEDQPPKVEPVAGTATSVTVVPMG